MSPPNLSRIQLSYYLYRECLSKSKSINYDRQAYFILRLHLYLKMSRSPSNEIVLRRKVARILYNCYKE